MDKCSTMAIIRTCHSCMYLKLKWTFPDLLRLLAVAVEVMFNINILQDEYGSYSKRTVTLRLEHDRACALIHGVVSRENGGASSAKLLANSIKFSFNFCYFCTVYDS